MLSRAKNESFTRKIISYMMYDTICDIIIIFLQESVYCREIHHLWGYKVTEEKRKVEEQDPNLIACQMFPV